MLPESKLLFTDTAVAVRPPHGLLAPSEANLQNSRRRVRRAGGEAAAGRRQGSKQRPHATASRGRVGRCGGCRHAAASSAHSLSALRAGLEDLLQAAVHQRARSEPACDALHRRSVRQPVGGRASLLDYRRGAPPARTAARRVRPVKARRSFVLHAYRVRCCSGLTHCPCFGAELVFEWRPSASRRAVPPATVDYLS